MWIEDKFLKNVSSLWLIYPDRWCNDVCTIQPGEVEIPLKVTDTEGTEHEVDKSLTSILWPWDIIHWMWGTGIFKQWAADDPKTAEYRNQEFWQHCSHLEFYKKLGMSDSQHRSTVPIYVHADGVKIYKSQKAWVYSISSACRKGPSIKTKLVVILLRENRIIKEKTHDSVGILMSYIFDTLMSGKFPQRDHQQNAFKPGSLNAARAGTPFCGNWRFAFAGFKGDWEARYIIHKSKRFYNATWICDHCLASRDPDYSFGDFRLTANCLSHRFSHDEYMIMQGDKQSTWRFVKGWTKDRNLEVT